MTNESTRGAVSRRTYLAAAGSAGALSGFAGCLELITGETLEFGASPSRVSQDALDSTGYERSDQREIELEREFEAGGESRTVVVTNVMTEYHKAVDMGPLGEAQGAFFSSLTTPQVEVLGQEFNPVRELSTKEIAEMVQQQYNAVEDFESEDETEILIQGKSTTQTKFKAAGAFDGSQVDLFVHVSEAVEMGDDFVVTVGAYPELLPDEEENILSMMEAVEPDE